MSTLWRRATELASNRLNVYRPAVWRCKARLFIIFIIIIIIIISIIIAIIIIT